MGAGCFLDPCVLSITPTGGGPGNVVPFVPGDGVTDIGVDVDRKSKPFIFTNELIGLLLIIFLIWLLTRKKK
jgi:hypothetical protein